MSHASWKPGVARGVRGTLLLSVGLLASGCAQWSYDRIQIGQPLREYERAFPEEHCRRSASTISYLEENGMGRTDAIVVLVTRDRRVCGRFHAVHVERDYGFARESGYVCTGELDPQLSELAQVGPVDILRALADQITILPGDRVSRDAHAWVAAGLVRLVQRWPNTGDAGPAVPRITDILDRVPAGGDAQVRITERGAYAIEYVQGARP